MTHPPHDAAPILAALPPPDPALALEGILASGSEVEHRLREANDRLNLALAASSQGVFEIDVQDRTGFVSRREWSMGGEERPGFASLAFDDWAGRVHPEDRDDAVEAADAILAGTTRVYRHEYRFRPADAAAYRWVHAVGSVVDWNPDGSPRRLIGTWRDVTDQKETEAALRRSEARHRRLFETISQGVMHRAAEGRVVEVNPAAQRMLGGTLEELRAMDGGVSRWAAIRPDGTPLAEDEYPSVVARRTGRDVAPQVLSVLDQRTGCRRWLLVAAGPMRDDEAGDGVYMTFTDVDALQQAEAALRESEEKYRAVVENSPDILSRIGPDLRTLFVSPAVRDYLGLDPEAVVGRRPGEIEGIPPDVAAHVERSIRSVFEDGAPRTENLEYPGPDGTVSLDWRLFPERDPKGAVRTVVSIVRDQTTERQLEEQVREAQKMEAVGQLAGGIAHDFNNLLTVIRGHASLALEEASGAVREDLEEIERSADRAAALTRQLLAFGRRQVRETRVVDLGEIVEGMAPMIRRLIGEHIEVRTVLEPDRDLVRVDPGQIEQVIMNLVVNARDSMPDGGRLGIRVARRKRGRVREDVDRLDIDATCLEVSDTGCGMDEATLVRVFEPFYTTKPVGKGTGLGLSTVYGIVKQNRGKIDVESEPGRGSRFRVCLPAASHREAEREPEGAERVASPSTVPGTILIVEDESPLRELARRFLEEAGHRVVEAAGPVAALRLIRSEGADFDLVLSDIVMPELTGPELVQRIAGIRPGLPAIYMTGYSPGLLPDGGMGVEGESVLAKPFSREELTARVTEALERARGGGERAPLAG